jgi:dihydroxyacetone kinase DhaKLM complex PTS-EIIA-like component DhaM
MANFAATINTPFFRTLNVRGIDIMASMAGGSMSAENIKEMKTLAAEVIDTIEGPVVYSVSSDTKNKPPFAVKYLIAVEDENKFNQIIDKAVDMMNTSGIMDFYKSMGIETSFSMKKDFESYKDVSISSAKLSLKAIGAASPQAQMVTSMYGEGFDYRWGLVDGLFACAVSGDVDATIRKLIDEAKAGGPKQIGSEMKAALSLLPESNKADFLLTFNVLRLLKMVTSMVPIPIPPMEAQTKSNIVIAGSAANSRMVVNIAVPKQHLTEIMAAFMAMQQKSGTMNQ